MRKPVWPILLTAFVLAVALSVGGILSRWHDHRLTPAGVSATAEQAAVDHLTKSDAPRLVAECDKDSARFLANARYYTVRVEVLGVEADQAVGLIDGDWDAHAAFKLKRGVAALVKGKPATVAGRLIRAENTHWPDFYDLLYFDDAWVIDAPR